MMSDKTREALKQISADLQAMTKEQLKAAIDALDPKDVEVFAVLFEEFGTPIFEEIPE